MVTLIIIFNSKFITMPKYGIHQIVLSRAMAELAEQGSVKGKQAASDMYAHEDMAMLGGVGPDLFFWAADFEEVGKLMIFYNNVENIVNTYKDATAPFRDIKNAVGEVTDRLVGTLANDTQQLIRTALEEVKETAKLLNSSISSGLFNGILGLSDAFSSVSDMPDVSNAFFNNFKPPLQQQLMDRQSLNKDHWYWFDMLHYRRTGRFANALIQNAKKGSSRQRAYAYGYLSHIATDVIGHAYVNQIVGAPYRLNVQRHVTVENYMDTWAFKNYYNNERVSKNLLRRLKFPSPGNLSDEIINLLDTSLRDAYTGYTPKRLGGSGFLSKNQIREAYETFHLVLSQMENMAIERPEEPFSNVLDILNDALQDLINPPPSPPDFETDMCSWKELITNPDCYTNAFDNAAKAAAYLGELITYAVESLIDIVDMILATLASIPINVMLALLYAAQLLLFETYLVFRQTIAEFGFTYPEPEHLGSGTANAFTTTILGCASQSYKYVDIGGMMQVNPLAVEVKDLNLLKFPLQTENNYSHFVCPSGVVEQPVTRPEFYPSSSIVTPTVFMDQIPFSEENLFAYAGASNPDRSRALGGDGLRIGSARGFTSWMIDKAAQNDLNSATENVLYTNWNLDSDRGYGYKEWNGHLLEDQLRLEEEFYL
jgi:hypothetical protein